MTMFEKWRKEGILEDKLSRMSLKEKDGVYYTFKRYIGKERLFRYIYANMKLSKPLTNQQVYDEWTAGANFIKDEGDFDFGRNNIFVGER
jgi:hypothetical protein